ncbi:6572_t:CDS:2 [Funneliformis mosseae]|uniref:6572_t:CDS:1 n=1 Tax=Funneliformis mosseae TaxID=27381 RepID=A0A9N9BHY5_FUNMO|nr:6572_t:CDS:2 [Funneliformis mosseae]
MSNIAPSGTLINLWCIIRENRSIFKITIGTGNDLIDLRKVIKEERKPRFDDFAPDELILWRTNVASNVLRNKETAIEPYLNEKLKDPANTVENTFQNVVGNNNIRVVVGVPVTDDPLRQSFANFLNIPDDVSDISSHLMFVDRYEEIKNLMRNMKNLHNLINNLDNIPEPKKHVMFTTAVGTAGKGKATFARRAYYEKDIYLNVTGEGLSNVVQECLYAGLNFRIDCSSFEGEELKIDMEPEKPFGKRLLYEALKYHLRGKTIDEFFKILGEFSIDLVDILKLILEYHPCK